MARPLRLEYPGAFYHVTARGNARQAIYADDIDRQAFLEIVGDAILRFNWLCHAYCLMENHYHLLIETPEGNLSRGMRHVNGVYTQRINRRHERVGHLLQGRFKGILVEQETYLLELCRYIVLNPVRIQLVSDPADYRWSSFRATAGLEPAVSWLTRDWILAQFHQQRRGAERRYQAFVREGMNAASPWSHLRGQVLLGTDQFVNDLTPLLEGKRAIKEVPRAQRYAHRPTLSQTLSVRKLRTRPARDAAIRVCYLKYGYTMQEIAKHLGLHYTTVSKVVNQRT
jgi:REP element-mobilizing transposase RayT